jgi:acyl-CoA dehydrogenase
MSEILSNLEVREEFRLLYSKVERFVKDILDPLSLTVEKEEKIPEEIVDKIRELGLFGMPVPKEYGGLGLTTVEEMLIYEELTKTNGCYRSRIGTSNGIGSMGIVYDGTEEQKKKYLPLIASGKWSTAFALTEPNAGSDAANICMSAVFKDDHWVLNGNKIFITNADVAQLFTVIAVTDEEKRASGGVSAFIVEKGMPGFIIGSADVKMGLKGSHTHELVFKDCRVPAENVIGGMERVGQGFRTAMKVLDKGRLSMGACSLGASKKIMQLCQAGIKKKMDSGRDKGKLQADQFALADMAIQIYAAQQMLYNTAKFRDEGKNVTIEASMVKVFCTEMASRIADRGLDIIGEDGILSRNQIEILLRDVRLYRIYEGTSEIQRMIVSRKLIA